MPDYNQASSLARTRKCRSNADILYTADTQSALESNTPAVYFCVFYVIKNDPPYDLNMLRPVPLPIEG